MSWVQNENLSIFCKMALNILKFGRIPNHIAFIMDGNRRYAKRHNFLKSEGHSKGFYKLAETLSWCLELEVKEVTMYAFSIENFKRPPDEVESLLNLAREKFQALLDEEENLKRYGVNVRIIGNLSLMPEDIQKLIANAMLMTVNNNKLRLNIAFPYSGRDEITAATRAILQGLSEGSLSKDKLTPSLLQASLYTQDSPSPDLLIRTGEKRLSDFLPWQCSHTLIYFSPVLWPEFSLWNFILAILRYQRDGYKLLPVQQKPEPSKSNPFLMDLYAKRRQALQVLVQD